MKMKSKKKMLITALLVAMSLNSTGFAMPSGSSITAGGSNITITADALNKILNIGVGANGVINWDTFSIAKGESVSFNFSTAPSGSTSFSVLNRVTGAEMSQLMGTLTSTNTGNVFLINPNGIVVGPNATINASNLVLSTLNLTDENFLKVANGTEQGRLTFSKFVDKDGNSVSNPINGAIVVNGNLSNVRYLSLIGGSVTVAPGVTITPGDSVETNLDIVAANKVDFLVNNDPATDYSHSEGIYDDKGISGLTTQVGNDVTLNNSAIHATYIDVRGNTVNVTNHSNIKGTQVFVLGLNSANYDANTNITTYQAVPQNTVKIENSQLQAESRIFNQGTNFEDYQAAVLAVGGGSVELKNSKFALSPVLDTYYRDSFVLAAGNQGTSSVGSNSNTYIDANDDGLNYMTAAATPSNVLKISGSTITNGDILAMSGNTMISDSTISGHEIFMAAGKNLSIGNTYYLDNGTTDRRYDEFWFGNNWTTAKGNDFTVGNGTTITSNGESAFAGYTVTNNGTINANDHFGTGLLAVTDYKGDSKTPTVTAENTVFKGTIHAQYPEEVYIMGNPVAVAPVPTPAPAPASITASEAQQQGQAEMLKILSSDQPKAMTEVMIKKLNDGSAAKSEKDAYIVGVLTAIQADNTRSELGKQTLQQLVVDSYAGTAQSKVDEKNKVVTVPRHIDNILSKPETMATPTVTIQK